MMYNVEIHERSSGVLAAKKYIYTVSVLVGFSQDEYDHLYATENLHLIEECLPEINQGTEDQKARVDEKNSDGVFIGRTVEYTHWPSQAKAQYERCPQNLSILKRLLEDDLIRWKFPRLLEPENDAIAADWERMANELDEPVEPDPLTEEYLKKLREYVEHQKLINETIKVRNAAINTVNEQLELSSYPKKVMG